VLQTIEVRYGEEAVGDYLNYAAQFLMQALHAEDRIFHWGKDVLMAVIRRATSADSVRMEVARLALGSHEYLINANGRCIMINSPITFEMLPAGQFSNLDALLDAFTSNQAVKS
jgi:hypothetical protein